MQVLWGCRRVPDVSLVSAPEFAEFEKEVSQAISQSKGAFDLVQVPMPGAIKAPGASPLNRFGMAIDLDACDGCGKCILACIEENNIPLSPKEQRDAGRFMHWIEMHGGAPTMCFHCGNAPCEKVCPTGAASHTPDGISTMMYKRCTGSRFCGANCPVGARKFNFVDGVKEGLARKFNPNVPLRGKGVMEKCSLCLQRLQDHKHAHMAAMPGTDWRGSGLKTACSESCPKNAIVFGNWLDPKSPLVEAAKKRNLYVPSAIASLDPSVVYIGGRR
jgi:molybdopterin-containing oxidoreductase family iron-sulfur binding subunit